MASQSRIATNRIPITPELHEELREFRDGLKLSFSEAIAVLLAEAKQGDDAYTAGKRLRKKLASKERA